MIPQKSSSMGHISRQLPIITANNHKYKNVVVDQKAKFMSEQLDVEINLDRKKHAKKFLKPAKKGEAKSKKQSTTDPFTRENTRKSSLIMLT